MAHYIDKDALVAEIEKLIQQHSSKEYIDEAGCVLDELEDFLDALEVKDVDLEKELKEYIDGEWSDEWSGDVGNWIRWRRGTSSMTVEDVKDIAKHFFELGMKAGNKAQKIQDEIKIGETEIYLEDDGGEPPYDGIQWLDLSCMEYEIPKDNFKDGDNVEIIIRKTQKGE